MRDFIDRWRDIAIGEVSHQDVTVGDHPVAWWFDRNNATTEAFMAALVGDPQLVVPGRPNESKFITRFLRPTRPMGQRLQGDRPIVEQWIADGALVPAAQGVPVDRTPALTLAPAPGARSQPSTSPFSPQMTPAEVQQYEPEYFHRLINSEDFPDFLPTARELAHHYFEIGRQKEEEEAPGSLWFVLNPGGFPPIIWRESLRSRRQHSTKALTVLPQNWRGLSPCLPWCGRQVSAAMLCGKKRPLTLA